MNKIVLILLLNVLLLSGCQSIDEENVSKNKIVEEGEMNENKLIVSSLPYDDEEYAILKTTGMDNTMIYSIESKDQNVAKIEHWIDHYSHGLFKDKLSMISSEIPSKDNNIKIYLSTMKIDEDNELWIVSDRNGGNVSSGKTNIKVEKYDSSMSHFLQEQQIELGEEVTLGYIVRNFNKSSFSATDNIQNTIKDSDEVYVLRCKVN